MTESGSKTEEVAGRRRLARILIGVFVVAFLMGPGPGIYLVNPSPDDPSPATVWGMPILYVWTVGWFLVLAITVIVAYAKLWAAEGEDEA